MEARDASETRGVKSTVEKHPKTAERIEAYLDEILPLIEAEAAKSEILASDFGPIGPIVTERASRPLIHEPDPEVRKEAAKHIVKIAEKKEVRDVSEASSM